MAHSSNPPWLRVVTGEVETTNATTRLVLPTSDQPAWPPYLRVGETAVNRARPFPAHSHLREEVLTYVIEGFASYQMGDRPEELVKPGGVRLLTSPSRSAHRIRPSRGGPIRWFNLVVRLSEASTGEPRIQASDASAAPPSDEDAFVRPLVGPGSSMTSGAGLECHEITFLAPGTIFHRVGHGRRGLVYAIAGRGTVDGHRVEGGEAALVEDAAGIAVQGTEGFRAISATAPRSE